MLKAPGEDRFIRDGNARVADALLSAYSEARRVEEEVAGRGMATAVARFARLSAEVAEAAAVIQQGKGLHVTPWNQ